MRDIFVTLVVFGSLPMILYRPYIGVLMWSWIGYMNPHRLCWGFAYDFPYAMIIAIVTLTGLLFSKEKKSIPWTRETVVLIMFIIWMCITTIFAVHAEIANDQLIKVLKIEFMTFVTLMLMKDRHRIDMLVWTIALSLGFYGVKGGVFTVMGGGISHVLGPPGSFIGGNNETGLALIMTIPLMRYLHLQTKRNWVKWGLTAAMGLTIVAILGTQSRGALLGLMVMSAMLIWKTRRRFALSIVVGTVLFAGISFMPGSWHSRMQTIDNYQNDPSALGRINAWEFAFNLAKDNPILGAGYQAFMPDLFVRYAPDPSNVHDAHSIYFEVLAEHGFVGFGLFILLGWFTWRSCSLVVKQARPQPDGQWMADLAGMLQVSLVGFATSGAFLGLAYFDLYYHLIALVILLKMQSRQLTAQVMAASSQEGLGMRSIHSHGAVLGRYAG
jgi:probable O-glycosylation ligase (exosortase A-associated)